MRAEARAVIQNEVGLHARPAALFVKSAKRFASDITLRNLTRGGDPVDAKSPVQVIKAGVAQGHEVLISAEGPDADEAVAALVGLIERELG